MMTRAAEHGRVADAQAQAHEATAAQRKLKATGSRRYLDIPLSDTIAHGADLITQRLALWGVHVDGGGGEDDAILVDDDKVHEELPEFLAAQLPQWDGSQQQQQSIVIFRHDRAQVRARRCLRDARVRVPGFCTRVCLTGQLWARHELCLRTAMQCVCCLELVLCCLGMLLLRGWQGGLQMSGGPLHPWGTSVLLLICRSAV